MFEVLNVVFCKDCSELVDEEAPHYDKKLCDYCYDIRYENDEFYECEE